MPDTLTIIERDIPAFVEDAKFSTLPLPPFIGGHTFTWESGLQKFTVVINPMTKVALNIRHCIWHWSLLVSSDADPDEPWVPTCKGTGQFYDVNDAIQGLRTFIETTGLTVVPVSYPLKRTLGEHLEEN